MALDASDVGGAIARGGNAAHTAQSAAGEHNPLDVWTHTGEGFGQQGVTSSMDLSHWGSTPVGDVPGAMKGQAAGLVEALKAVKDADGALATTGAVFGVLTSAEQLISIPFSAIPFPALPAVRVLDFAIGLPHAHSHPPNLIPPAPPIPLPSFGPVIPIPFLSGAGTVLINGMPAGRCLDMGLGIWCGGYFPMFEIFLGSSSVWIEGMRAARIGVDITKHCVFSSFKVAPGDPPLGVPIGTTVTASPNVIIGGVPMPSLTAMAVGAAMKGAFKGLGKLAGIAKAALAKRAARTAIIESVKDRIAKQDGFNLRYTDAELGGIVRRGERLGLSPKTIEDLIFVASRDKKAISAAELAQQMDNWANVIDKRGFPYKFKTLAEFKEFGKDLRDGLQRAGFPVDDIRVQGSSLRKPGANDVDIAVFADRDRFDKILTDGFDGKVRLGNEKVPLSGKSHEELQKLADDIAAHPERYNSNAQSFKLAFNNRAINSKSKYMKPLKGVRAELAEKYPDLNLETIGVQSRGGPFDLLPEMPFP